MFLRLGQGEGVFKLKAKKVILGSGRLRAGSIIAEEAGRFFPVPTHAAHPLQPSTSTRIWWLNVAADSRPLGIQILEHFEPPKKMGATKTFVGHWVWKNVTKEIWLSGLLLWVWFDNHSPVQPTPVWSASRPLDGNPVPQWIWKDEWREIISSWCFLAGFRAPMVLRMGPCHGFPFQYRSFESKLVWKCELRHHAGQQDTSKGLGHQKHSRIADLSKRTGSIVVEEEAEIYVWASAGLARPVKEMWDEFAWWIPFGESLELENPWIQIPKPRPGPSCCAARRMSRSGPRFSIFSWWQLDAPRCKVRGLISAKGLGCAPNRGEGPGTAPQLQAGMWGSGCGHQTIGNIWELGG